MDKDTNGEYAEQESRGPATEPQKIRPLKVGARKDKVRGGKPPDW